MNFTVILLRPAYLCDEMGEDYGKNIYVAHVAGADYRAAIAAAQREVYDSDREDDYAPQSPADYQLCVLFDGTHDPKLFGWQAG